MKSGLKTWKKVNVQKGGNMGSFALLAIGTGIFFGYKYLSKLNRANEQIEAVSYVRIRKITFSKLFLEITSVIKNPSDAKLGIDWPTIKLFHNQKLFGMSEVKNDPQIIPAKGELTFDNIALVIPLINIPALAKEVVEKNLLDPNKVVKISVQVLSNIHTKLGSTPYEKTDEITL